MSVYTRFSSEYKHNLNVNCLYPSPDLREAKKASHKKVCRVKGFDFILLSRLYFPL